jgi:Rha family phage regulatory protein
MSATKQQATPAVYPVVTVNNHQILTNSLNVAGVFEKPHSSVLKAIRSLNLPDTFNAVNFYSVDYVDAKGEKRPMVNLTRDGFTLLAMGFTGPKAMKFKLAYIEAFNRMEAELVRQKEEAARPAVESDRSDPSRLAESLMQALIASLSGKHNDKIDDLGVEIVSRLQDLSDNLSDMPDRDDLLPALQVLGGNITGLRKQLIAALPKLAMPDDLVESLRTVSKRLTAIADQQDNRDFAFHERLRAMEMKFRGVKCNQTVKMITGEPGVWDYIEGNVPETLRHKFNLMKVPKLAGSPMLLRFMNECLIPDPESKIEVQRLYSVYCAWCFANMNTPLSVTSYRQLLKGFSPNFEGMTVKMENYVPYLIGAKIRIPREISHATGEKSPAAAGASERRG